MMTTLIKLKCALCQSVIVNAEQFMLEKSEVFFCCKGCLVVYEILQAQGALEQFQDHPVYRQALQAGLITNPTLLFSKEEEHLIPNEEFQKLHLSIQNMWCPSCAQVIYLIMLREKGVRNCVVDYSTDLAFIEYTPRLISKEKIIRVIELIGYHPQFLRDSHQNKINRSLRLRFIIAAFCTLNVMMFSYPIYATYFNGGDSQGYANLFAWLSMFSSLPVLFYSAWPIWRRFIIGFKVGIWGMEALVCMGIITSYGLSFYELWKGTSYVYFDSITAIITFVLLGKIIETRAKFSAKDALIKLSLELPRRGRKRFLNGDELFVPIKEFQPGDQLAVKMGEKIVLDGIVFEGGGLCDESLLTGESVPVVKQKGMKVFAGTLLQQGNLIFEVVSSLEETVLQNIINMVGQEIEHKSRYLRAADSIVKWFIPFVILLAISVGMGCLYWEIRDPGQTVTQTALLRAISILLISCPCAIGIAAPLAEAYILNALAKNGVIVRNRGCLSYLGRETAFVFDKTGTLTEGKFTVYDGIKTLSHAEQSILKGLTKKSLHPVSVAIHHALTVNSRDFDHLEEIVGKGIEGTLEGEVYCLGSRPFLDQQGIVNLPLPKQKTEHSILTTVYFSKGKQCIGTILLGDQLKKGVPEFICCLNPIKTYLISGDSLAPVEKVAKACHIENWIAECLPLQKKEFIDLIKRKGEIIAMIGDGMNDAPALAAAHIGIAVVSASDISAQVSDLLMTTNSFEVLLLLRKIAIKGQKIIKQNLFWAFFYNCIGLALAAAGLLTPLFSAFAMVASSLIVLLNAHRLSFKFKS